MRGMGPERDFLEEEDLDEARATLITTRGVKSKAELDIITATPGFKEHAAEVFRLGEIRWRAIVEKMEINRRREMAQLGRIWHTPIF